MRHVKGFTLIEMVGVVAVIGILASVATPMVYDAIKDSRATAMAQSLKNLKPAVANFYADTGRLPVHRPFENNPNTVNLTRNPTPPIPGWNGPYIEEPDIGTNGVTALGIWTNNTSGINSFDVDGDGTREVQRSTLFHMDIPDQDLARRISDIFDRDSDVDTGNGAWFSAGNFHRQGHGANGNRYNYLLVAE
ncbi:MAG: prepilin-type N-terminal cleavage/methylation domain-containing protein [Pseudomonadota bacterium]